MDTKKDWIVIGRFGRPHGIKGLVTIISFTEPRDNILNYTNWHACIHDVMQPLKLFEIGTTNKNILTKVEEYPEREDVARLTNVDIVIKRGQLATLEPGEYYWHQLIGMEVFNQEGSLLGLVKEILPTGANDVLVVMGEKRHLIPYLPGKFVKEINNSQRIINVDWDADF